MPRVDGTGDLELFLQRFRTLADYYEWSNSEQLFRLKNSMQGDAQYLLLYIVHPNNAQDSIDALKAVVGRRRSQQKYGSTRERHRRPDDQQRIG